ncbi:hypothetical protein CCAND93_20052 [Capnocytophaga canis]|uniref:Uncharacterized protein n=1 Tax=Capnocytophaga canis TaxID=1848903 RepID=A0A0B7IPI9_9FLAO|nr:hypothetical protein CCAND93_20052 [Capnocytophaga canis]
MSVQLSLFDDTFFDKNKEKTRDDYGVFGYRNLTIHEKINYRYNFNKIFVEALTVRFSKMWVFKRFIYYSECSLIYKR